MDRLNRGGAWEGRSQVVKEAGTLEKADANARELVRELLTVPESRRVEEVGAPPRVVRATARRNGA
ncbi:MAG: hypothetical protein M3N18_00365 [Actinomycetota bacterium]|nr:hypothetical protein [Actinomycetota bacterium]